METWHSLVEARLAVRGASADPKDQADSQMEVLAKTGIRRSMTSDIEASHHFIFRA